MRYYYLDLARGVLMSLGVIYHSSQVFKSNSVWLLVSNEQSYFFNYVIRFLHSFRMESFYIISGFFSLMILDKYSTKRFLSSRLKRLAIPMLFGGITLNSIMHIYSINTPFVVFSSGYWWDGYWLGHLWFLASLIIYSFILLSVKPLHNLLSKINDIKINYLIIILLVGLSVMILRRMEWRLPDPLIGNRWLQKKVILYAPYFFIGSFFYINRDAFNKMHVSYATNLILFIGGFFIVVLGFDAGNEYVNEFVHAIFGIVVSGLLFGVFNLFFDKPSSVSYHISDSSYTVYVLHQPLIVILGYYVLKMPVHYVFQFIVILIMGWLMPYLFHKYFVRKFGLIGLLLNGKDYK